MPAALPFFLTMATTLFDNASHKPEVAQVLAQFGFTAAKLAKERTKIVELSAAMQAQDAATGGAQQATSEQTKALETLDNWMSAFVQIAKVALRAQPQLLEKLGILKRSSKTKAQRTAPAKAAATRKAKKEAGGPVVH
jgi:hypothetical protein